jgi:putative zinc finger/helix-turn-helix YgiT family protein
MEDTPMTCLECGGKMTSAREAVKYDASGLSRVTLVNVEVRRCRKCGAYEVVIPKIEELHRLIAAVVIQKQEALAPEEIRYLRKYLGWSGVDFAAHMGATPETISRWENGKLAMSPQADRLLRTMVALREPASDYKIDALKQILPKKAKPLRVGLRSGPSGWRKDTAA